jgi:hypothetical protein
MKTDAFTLTVLIAIVISVATSGVVILITQNNSTSIPTVERGTVVLKNTITASDSVVELSNGVTLHVLNNAPLYLSLNLNQSYVFNCLYNHVTKITVIQNAQNDTS